MYAFILTSPPMERPPTPDAFACNAWTRFGLPISIVCRFAFRHGLHHHARRLPMPCSCVCTVYLSTFASLRPITPVHCQFRCITPPTPPTRRGDLLWSSIRPVAIAPASTRSKPPLRRGRPCSSHARSSHPSMNQLLPSMRCANASGC
jgi:hypothetical protein